MNRALAVLLAALVIQCGIAAAVYWPAQSPQGAAAGEVFAPFSPGDIDRLTIGDEYDNEVVLARSGAHWVIPGLYGLPADSGREARLAHIDLRFTEAYLLAIQG